MSYNKFIPLVMLMFLFFMAFETCNAQCHGNRWIVGNNNTSVFQQARNGINATVIKASDFNVIKFNKPLIVTNIKVTGKSFNNPNNTVFESIDFNESENNTDQIWIVGKEIIEAIDSGWFLKFKITLKIGDEYSIITICKCAEIRE